MQDGPQKEKNIYKIIQKMRIKLSCIQGYINKERTTERVEFIYKIINKAKMELCKIVYRTRIKLNHIQQYDKRKIVLNYIGEYQRIQDTAEP